MYKKSKMKQRKGFTLIELVLVIAIIGILGAIAIPKFTGVADDASKKADLVSARTIESAVNLALLDEGDLSEVKINNYLSNIKINLVKGEDVVTEDSKGWYVKLLDEGVLKIYKDGKLISDESTEPKEGEDSGS